LVRTRWHPSRRPPGTGCSVGRSPWGPLTPRTKKVLELALREAIRLKHNWIGSEHILLGLLREGNGLAAKIMFDAGIDLAALRRTVEESLRTAA